eukprot:NODE_12542_length_277_cov_12.565789_g11629_i0.p3 GENE.NODE_12542_length_277_cov_12.565789_g11629_i0~~NODE_12542_length_277_cov_12.565789_g11629_i0.p3  ORF type:complete len:55 (-),score=0.72 NODE_12542_length_277_cov_12.565789_g11629_i0:39-203(-)
MWAKVLLKRFHALHGPIFTMETVQAPRKVQVSQHFRVADMTLPLPTPTFTAWLV